MLAEQDPERLYPEIREAVRDLCAGFDSAYWQRVEEQEAFPERFVQALCKIEPVVVSRSAASRGSFSDSCSGEVCDISIDG